MSPSSAISANTGGDLERVRDLVADRRREPGEVVEAVARDVGEAADVDRGAQQVEHRGDVDLGRLEQDLAERPAEPVVVRAQLGERAPRERVAVRVQARRGQADQRVAGLDAPAVDDRVELDQADGAAAELDPRDDVADLGDLAAGDLDPGELRSAAQADADRAADLRVGLARRG